MKNLLFICMALFLANHTAKAQFQLELEIINLKSDEGYVMIDLVDAQGKSVQQFKEPVRKKSCVLSIKELKSSVYGIRYYHDENENGEMDSGLFGIPEEGYGFSNNAKGRMGPPDLEEYLFRLDSDTQMTLKTINW
jgi:uncharacterized protein (DUF2141 family)